MSDGTSGGRTHDLSRTGVMYSRLFARNPNDLYGLYCPSCGHRVCQISVFSNVWEGYCPECGTKHNVHSVVAVPDRMNERDDLPVEDVQGIFVEYLDDVARHEYQELDFEGVLDLAERVDVDWSPFDPLFRRRVGSLAGHSVRDTVRTQMIYTKDDHYDLDPHLRTSELTYYVLHGFLPMWGQEQVALDCGLDGWGMWAAYELLELEMELQSAHGDEISLDDVEWDDRLDPELASFLDMVVRRYALKFDARELVKAYHRVDEVVDDLYEKRDELQEEWARSLTTEQGHKSISAGFHDRQHEITTRNTFDSLAAAEEWIASLHDRFETEWERTLDAARVKGGELDAVGFETASEQVMFE